MIKKSENQLNTHVEVVVVVVVVVVFGVVVLIN